jgi:hypothetical protein
MASDGPKMRKKSTVGKRKHVTVTIPQKLEIIRRLESGDSQGMVHLHRAMDDQLPMLFGNRQIMIIYGMEGQ